MTFDQPQRLTYTPAEARLILGIGRKAIYALLRSGALRSIKVGRKLLISRQDVVEFLADSACPDRQERTDA